MSKFSLKFFSLCVFLLTGCDNERMYEHIAFPPELPQKPYESWRIGGRYPNRFQAKVFGVTVKTQSNQIRGASIAIGSDHNWHEREVLTQWRIPRGWPDAMYAAGDLPEEIYVCWVSFVDQTFYKTKITIPLEIRKQMVIPFIIKYQVPDTNEVKEYTRYLDTIIIGFAPGGNVVAWLNGVSRKDGIEFAVGETERLGKNSSECPNPYQYGKIPEIEDDVKEWLKKHGMPKHWQEKPSVYETPSWKKSK